MRLPALTLILMFARLCSGQDLGGAHERLIEDTMQKYGLDVLATRAGTAGQTGIRNLQSLLAILRNQLGIVPLERTGREPILQFSGRLRRTILDDEIRAVFEDNIVSITLADSSLTAPRMAGRYINRMSVAMKKGSFSGMPVGDWVAHFDGGRDVTILFLRNNARVSVHCAATVEFTKAAQVHREIPDPDVRERCEDLARRIDTELQTIPLANGADRMRQSRDTN